MGLVRELTPAMLERATHVRSERDLALVAVAGEEPAAAIVGGARYAGTPDGEDCEFAVTVADEWKGLGLARQLMELLAMLKAFLSFSSGDIFKLLIVRDFSDLQSVAQWRLST